MRSLATALAVLFLSASTVGAQSLPSTPDLAAVASAEWLATTRLTPLRSGTDAEAAVFTELRSGDVVRPIGAPRGGWLRVFYPGDGGTRAAGEAWVDLTALAPGQAPDWLASAEAEPGAPRRASFTAPPRVTAREVAILDDASGRLLYGKAAHDRVAPASTAKIVTASVVLQRSEDLDQRIVTSVDGWAMALRDGSSIMGLSPGQSVTLRTLLYGLLLPSGNDAAEQLAVSVGGDRATFVGWMNEYVAAQHLANTRFVNPSGYDADSQFASAYDLAHLARAAMWHPVFADIVATPAYRGDGYELAGHNPLLGVYQGIDGVKTGTSDAAGRAMVASATREGRRVFVSVVHSERLAADCIALLDWVWEVFRWP
jgi:D-alanyl-D-alanine carboxypeptidase